MKKQHIVCTYIEKDPATLPADALRVELIRIAYNLQLVSWAKANIAFKKLEH